MKNDISLLDRTKYVVNDKITVHIPTIREIRGKSFFENGTSTDEIDYNSLINLFSVTSTDLMVELDKKGIDFTTVSDFTTFLMMFGNTPKELLRNKSPLLFDNINLADFAISIDPQTNQPVLYDVKHDICIDELIYMQLSTIFCVMNSMRKNTRKMGNDTMRKYAIEREKQHRKNKRRSNVYSSKLDKLIIALVNDCNFKYDFTTVNDLTIYNFYVSMQQISKHYQVQNTNMGIYMGTVSLKGMSDEARAKMLNWLDYEPYVQSQRQQQNDIETKTTYKAEKESRQ